MKYIFITGGVVSGLGKGICAASLGRLLKQRGLRVQNQKFDPYLNVDPGTMSPYQHGEVFVTDDGAETDLDLGHYERFTDENLTAGCSVSAGKVYWSVLCREREGGYLGRTVQIIPHITDEIKSRIYQMDNGTSDVLITEIGGTVGDIESQPFLEAIRQVAAEQGKKNVLFIHVPMIVEIPGSGELKSKPTQHSVKELLSIGIQPDILVCRTNQPMTEDICRKIALFCNMEPDCVIPNTTASTLYEVPLLLEREGLRATADSYALTDAGHAWLASLGLAAPTPATRRRFAYACMDWSERREHLAGQLATALFDDADLVGNVLQVLQQRLQFGRTGAVVEVGGDVDRARYL